MPKYKITKTFGHDSGYSCAFRQWNAKSNCSKIHGYSLGFEINLISHQLDENNWVFNFGDFKFLKKWLRDNFDHTLLIAKDDPFKEKFLELDNLKKIEISWPTPKVFFENGSVINGYKKELILPIFFYKEKNNKNKLKLSDWACPISKQNLEIRSNYLFSKESKMAYPVIDEIPILLKNKAILATHLDDLDDKV